MRLGQRLWRDECEEWVHEFEDIVTDSLSPKNIRGGFARSGTYPLDRELVTSTLPVTYPKYLGEKKRKTSLFDINNKVITNPDFLELWKEDDNNKLNEKNNNKLKEEKNRDEDNEVDIGRVMYSYTKKGWDVHFTINSQESSDDVDIVREQNEDYSSEDFGLF
jgi:hypothetical protein